MYINEPIAIGINNNLLPATNLFAANFQSLRYANSSNARDILASKIIGSHER
jgi:hypothetical protein